MTNAESYKELESFTNNISDESLDEVLEKIKSDPQFYEDITEFDYPEEMKPYVIKREEPIFQKRPDELLSNDLNKYGAGLHPSLYNDVLSIIKSENKKRTHEEIEEISLTFNKEIQQFYTNIIVPEWNRKNSLMLQGITSLVTELFVKQEIRINAIIKNQLLSSTTLSPLDSQSNNPKEPVRSILDSVTFNYLDDESNNIHDRKVQKRDETPKENGSINKSKVVDEKHKKETKREENNKVIVPEVPKKEDVKEIKKIVEPEPIKNDTEVPNKEDKPAENKKADAPEEKKDIVDKKEKQTKIEVTDRLELLNFDIKTYEEFDIKSEDMKKFFNTKCRIFIGIFNNDGKEERVLLYSLTHLLNAIKRKRDFVHKMKNETDETFYYAASPNKRDNLYDLISLKSLEVVMKSHIWTDIREKYFNNEETKWLSEFVGKYNK